MTASDKLSMIGAKYKLTREVMGNPAGSIAYCVDQYEDFDDKENGIGVQLIMENGATDGFSVKDQNSMLEYMGYVVKYMTYKFINVFRLEKDWRTKYWDFTCQP
jgi:hypothetical protein